MALTQSDQNRIDDDVLESLAFPEMLDRRDNIEQRHRTTCEWILELEEYKSWKSNSHGLLWIKGKPGAGKSTLMAYLHDEVWESQDSGNGNGIQLDFFFTARGTDLQRRPLGMLRSLLNQIFRSDEAVRPPLREFYLDRSKKVGNAHNWKWPQIRLERLLVEAILGSASRQPVTVFVDALDEAGGEAAQQLADYFYRLNDAAGSKSAVKICISSRHYPIVNSPGAREIIVEEHNHEDISTYINDKISETSIISHAPDQEAWRSLRKLLIQRTEAVFQWAHTIIPLVQRKLSDGHSPKDICRWLPDVPADLGNMYKYILEWVIDPSERPQVFLFFQWVSLAERPLSVTEIRYALAMKDAKMTQHRIQWEKIEDFVESNESMKCRIKALSAGLAEVTSGQEGGETIQVVHQSVGDFLRTEGLAILSGLAAAHTSPLNGEDIILQSQATLYHSCLVYFAREGLPNSERNRSHGDVSDLFTERPLLDYATCYIFVHAEKAGKCRAKKIHTEVQQLEQLIDRWVHLYFILNRHETEFPLPGTTLIHLAATANLVDRTPLLWAARLGRLEFVKWLLQSGANVNTRTSAGCALQVASEAGHEDMVQLLLEAGADVNIRSGPNLNALIDAASVGNAEIVQILLAANADVNAQSSYYGSALQASLIAGSLETTKILLAAGADVNAEGGFHGNPLQAASDRGSTEMVEILLAAGANIHFQGGRYGSALQAASRSWNAEKAQILLAAGADVNSQGGIYGNALQAASSAGKPETVRILLAAGAEVNSQGGKHSNALQAAIHIGSTETIQMLLAAGADVNYQGGEYGNALQAASCMRSAEKVKILLAAGVNVNSQGGIYGSALQGASYMRSAEKVEILLAAGADVNSQGGEYGNALQAASSAGESKIVRTLLTAGADVNSQGGKYGNALQAASSVGKPEIVRMLLNAGANVNAKGGYYGSALEAASSCSNAEIVQVLLDAGANVITKEAAPFGQSSKDRSTAASKCLVC
ncbi:uncharacterized protein N7500_009237 [Penicillium coprophilum]|uniref:uncharacterized protein n=1 Tax=Penicillium coprophilum TaxID=36646 RepID=UPI002386977B|nr:uncharacterized protein N7500_009237 [Penicillium coprophilum]KAJ5153798.1 hypothetical protein N7500_009237 [Penicillium coprophilum]